MSQFNEIANHDDLADHEFEYTPSENGELTQADIAALYAELGEAEQALVTIRDFIRFVVTKLRQYDVVVAQGTTDEFAEAANRCDGRLQAQCLSLSRYRRYCMAYRQ